jgi:hypothetical protein
MIYCAEQTNTSGGSTSFGVYTSFDSDGFTVNAGSSSAKNTNETGQTYVAWNWLGGGTGVSNTDGSITSTVSASQHQDLVLLLGQELQVMALLDTD